MAKGKLYLIPNIIADNTQDQVIPVYIRNVLPDIRYFLAEDIRTARRYLSSLKVYDSIEPLEFNVFDKDAKPDALRDLFRPLFEGHHVGVISEAGCPGVADPGALAVKFAHEHDIQVVPLVGPSSILLALMASGLNGQHFAFHGYLPIDAKETAKTIKELEKESRQKNQTQIFIETPYRNNNLLNVLLKNLLDETLLSIAVDLTGQQELIKTLSIKKWRSVNFTLPKTPVVFLFLAS